MKNKVQKIFKQILCVILSLAMLNILAVNASMHLLPMLETFDANCTFIRPGSSLQKRFAEECEKGTEFHFGMMYTATPEIETFGKKLM